MCLAPTGCMTKIRSSRIDIPHRVVIPRITPEYQNPWFCFYCDSLFPACWLHVGILVGGGGLSIPLSATVLAAVTVAAALLKANTHPPSSVDVEVTATAVTTSADVANDARYNPAVNRRRRLLSRCS